jgi:hypothetical protein
VRRSHQFNVVRFSGLSTPNAPVGWRGAGRDGLLNQIGLRRLD